MRMKASPDALITVDDVRRILQGPLELVIEGAEAYWLEDATGRRLGPESDRSLTPLALALDLLRKDRPSESLRLVARLANGQRFEICSGLSLIDIAEHAAGIPGRPRRPARPDALSGASAGED